MMLYSVILSSIVFPFVGKFCDAYSPKRTVPFAFFFRCSTTYMFCLLERPDSTSAYAVCVLMIIGTIIENISIDSIFNKNLPKETRGILNGVYSFAG
jgi:MFS-type transporter involved in bile tolerance (Atg22 family)